MSGSHSILAPSGSEMWSRCVGSLYLGKGLPSLDAEFNASGTCSHWLGQWQLENPDKDLNVWLGKELEFGDNPKFKFTIDTDRLDRVRTYVKRVRSEPGQLFVEQELDTSPVYGRPNQIGHADTVKLYPEGGAMIDEQLYKGIISIHDFKDGYIQVNARDNLQGLNYLAAAYYQFQLTGEYNAFRFCVHQPKIHHYDEWTYTREYIEAFIQAIRPVAQLAYDIFHGIVPFDPEKHLVAGEEQCFWCPVRGRCIARAKRMISMFEPIINRHELDTKTLGMMYARLDEIEAAVKDFRKEALRRAMLGDVIDGQKVVRGRRGNRKWKDKKKAEAALLPILKDKAYEPREVISPTTAEDLLTEEQYETLKKEGHVFQADGSLQLAPLDDKREAVKTGVDFKPVTEEQSLI